MKLMMIILILLTGITLSAQETIFVYVAVDSGYLKVEGDPDRRAVKFDSVFVIKGVTPGMGTKYRIDKTFKIEFSDKTLFDFKKKYFFIPKIGLR